jgi:phosphocarrier protein HPr
MLNEKITIANKLGLHARAAAKFVSCVSAFASSVRVGKDGDLVDAKSIMSVMMLAAGRGTILDLEVNGSDEIETVAALVALIENRFDEDE